MQALEKLAQLSVVKNDQVLKGLSHEIETGCGW
jgi:hypothetical protein